MGLSMRNLTSVVFVIVLFYSPAAWADLYECNGTWTNKPCDSDQVGKAIPATEVTKEAPKQDTQVEAASRKASLVHDLRMQALELKRSRGVETRDVDLAEQFCKREQVTVIACERRVNAVMRGLLALDQREHYRQEFDRRSKARQEAQERFRNRGS